MRLSAQVASVGMREGDEECHICRDDVPATIAFVPCKHKVCFGCMERMRAKNIFKVRYGAASGPLARAESAAAQGMRLGVLGVEGAGWEGRGGVV
jgi:hypothetical protein